MGFKGPYEGDEVKPHRTGQAPEWMEGKVHAGCPGPLSGRKQDNSLHELPCGLLGNIGLAIRRNGAVLAGPMIWFNRVFMCPRIHTRLLKDKNKLQYRNHSFV